MSRTGVGRRRQRSRKEREGEGNGRRVWDGKEWEDNVATREGKRSALDGSQARSGRVASVPGRTISGECNDGNEGSGM